MKNQYFGDNRDLFKYDLAYRVMCSGVVEHLTIIPMLTENDASGHGNKTNRSQTKAGTKNVELMSFLDKCLAENRRDIGEIESFFRDNDVNIRIYGKDRYFTHGTRHDYFKGIDDAMLSKSLILIDPDTGLEVGRPTEKHLLYSEARDLFDRMDDDSVLMVYQSFPRGDHIEYLNRRCEELKDNISGDWPVCIDDDKAIFFFLAKDEVLEHTLIHVVADYTECYSK